MSNNYKGDGIKKFFILIRLSKISSLVKCISVQETVVTGRDGERDKVNS